LLTLCSRAGTGKAERQRSTVQGRITNGTLFPNISTAISKDMDKLVKKTFRGLRDKVDAVLKLIRSDVDMALASGPQHRGDDENGDDGEEEMLREELGDVVKELKKKHEALLGILATI